MMNDVVFLFCVDFVFIKYLQDPRGNLVKNIKSSNEFSWVSEI